MKYPPRKEIKRLDHVLNTNIIEYNKVNDDIDNGLKFDISIHLTSSPVKEPQPVATIRLIGGKNSTNNFN